MKKISFIFAIAILFGVTGCNKDNDIEIIPPSEITDDNFHKYLLKKFDANNDGKIDINEANAVKTIELTEDDYSSFGQIGSIKGIEYFTNLETFIINGFYSDEALDFSKNINLKKLILIYGWSTDIDISRNISLKELQINGFYSIESIDISNNTALEIFDCRSSGIKSIITGNNALLTTLDCSETSIEALDLSKSPALKELYCNNTGLRELSVNNNTKLEILNINENNITEIDLSKNAALKELYCNKGTSSYPGYQEFEEIDISNNPLLEIIDFSRNKLTKFNTNNNPELTDINISGNDISYYNINQNPKLRKLNCSNTAIGSLDIRNTIIDTLYCVTTSLQSLNAQGSQTLKMLACSSNTDIVDVSGSTIETIDYAPIYIIESNIPAKIVSLRINDCPNLKEFYLLQVGQYSRGTVEIIDRGRISIDISNCKSLQKFWSNFIYDIKIDNCAELKEVTCKGEFEDIEFKNDKNIEYLYIHAPELKDIDLSSCTSLKDMHCVGAFESIDLSKNTNIDSLRLNAKDLKSLNTDALTNMRYMDLALFTMNSTLNLHKNNALEKIILRDTLNNYEYYGSSKYNLNIADLQSLRSINGTTNLIQEIEVSNCRNLEYVSFTLNYSRYATSSSLAGLKIKNCPTLQNIFCERHVLTSLEIKECPALDTLEVSQNDLTSIDFDKSPKYLDCSSNKFTTLDISGNDNLKYLYCYDNLITDLKLDGCTNLEVIDCSTNKIPSLSVDLLLKLKELYCNDNRLTTLDISENKSLDKIDCSENPNLTQLYLNNDQVFSLFKKGSNTEIIYKD